MNLDKVYKRDVTGKIRVWWPEVGEGADEGYWCTHSGTIDGEIMTSEWKYAEPKSQSSPSEQAYFNANAERNKKLKVDYKESLDDVDDSRYSIIRPMLANDFVGWTGPCYAQPKLDGMRCLANRDGLWTRTNRKIISTPHIEGILKHFFEIYPDIVLDGELYNHSLHDNFNLIMSLAKKTKPNFEALERSRDLIQYWVYDMYDLTNPELKFGRRIMVLEDILFSMLLTDTIRKVPTFFAKTEEDLDLNYMNLLEHGFEGQIVRLDALYEEKRSPNLLKRKEFKDEEFELIDIESGAGNWEGLAKRAICALPDGRNFGAGISGTQEFCLKLLDEKDKYKSVTIKYFALTPDGIPRFPIAIKFYEEEWGGLIENMKERKDLFS